MTSKRSLPILISLRQGRPGFTLDENNVAAIYCTVGIDVVSEVPRDDADARLRLDFTDVCGINNAISICVADQDAHRDGDISASGPAAYAYEVNAERLRIANVSQIHRDLTAAYAEAGYRSRATYPRRSCHLLDPDRRGESRDDLIVVGRAAGAIFNPRLTCQRKINIEVAGLSLFLSRNRADRFNISG